jgi:hypothetical protein
VPWRNVLAPEVRDGRNVQLHLRQATPPHNVSCATQAQAQELQAAIQRQLGTLLRVRMLDSELSGGAVEDAGMPAEQACSCCKFACRNCSVHVATAPCTRVERIQQCTALCPRHLLAW